MEELWARNGDKIKATTGLTLNLELRAKNGREILFKASCQTVFTFLINHIFPYRTIFYKISILNNKNSLCKGATLISKHVFQTCYSLDVSLIGDQTCSLCSL
ncbi:CLUMA_CG014573, isoform A [Clunio marinus]|uniref:CLUMA_CG014573, isoform A n=1 Tax=Clunio marinus TaxID=568069 RepID=A0A1J1IMB3_9DIPT|nr:CLUMA_CG014573, isoform A [Clunio marinus]